MTRTRKEIEDDLYRVDHGSANEDIEISLKNNLILEVPLDIRDALTKEEMKECEHDFGNLILSSYPPKQKCTKCGYTCFMETYSVPPIPEQLDEDEEKDSYFHRKNRLKINAIIDYLTKTNQK